jgi:hypothetical protein
LVSKIQFAALTYLADNSQFRRELPKLQSCKVAKLATSDKRQALCSGIQQGKNFKTSENFLEKDIKIKKKEQKVE